MYAKGVDKIILRGYNRYVVLIKTAEFRGK